MKLKQIEPISTLASVSTPSLKPAIFRWLLLFTVLCFSAIWIIDAISGIISPFDAFSYPICIGCFAVIYLLSLMPGMNYQQLHLMTYVIVAGYLICSSIWHHMASNGLFSNAAQWLGLNYVIAYLFLEVRKAVPTTIGVFLFTIVGHYIVLIQRYSLNDTLGIVLNIAVAHIVYIVLLWTVLKMRVESATIQERTKTLEYYAHVDPLTQILNRRGLETAFETLNVDRHQQNYAILIIDIDHFKQINDRYGHLIGDKILTEFAWHLTQLIDDDDVLGRWGGEEFVILTRRKIQGQIFSDAEHIRRVIDSLQMVNEVHITVSIGIGYSTEASTSLAVFHIADNNLYAAKHIGRNRVIDSDKAASLIPASTTNA